MDTTLVFNFAAALLAIVNPIGNLPLFIGYTARVSPPVQRWLALFMAGTILALLMPFLALGNGILDFFGITLPAFRIAGGILLLLIGIGMVRGEHSPSTAPPSATAENADQSPPSPRQEAQALYRQVLIPLGIPIFVGPGSIGTAILYSSQSPNLATLGGLMGVVVLVSSIVWGVLLTAGRLQQWLGDLGLDVATRLLGLVLAAISIQFMIDGLRDVTLSVLHEG